MSRVNIHWHNLGAQDGDPAVDGAIRNYWAARDGDSNDDELDTAYMLIDVLLEHLGIEVEEEEE